MPDPYPEENIDIVTGEKKKTGFHSLINTKIGSMKQMLLKKAKDFEESEHPRASDGEFTSAGNEGKGSSQNGSGDGNRGADPGSDSVVGPSCARHHCRFDEHLRLLGGVGSGPR